MNAYSVINSRAPRLDAPDKATGRAIYTDDLHFPNMLWGRIAKSFGPCPHY